MRLGGNGGFSQPLSSLPCKVRALYRSPYAIRCQHLADVTWEAVTELRPAAAVFFVGVQWAVEMVRAEECPGRLKLLS